MFLTRCVLVLLVLAVSICGATAAEDKKVSIALSGGAFFPVNSEVRDKFDDYWTRVSFKTFEAEKPMEWRFIAEAGGYVLDGPTKARLYPITAGFERGLRESSRLQPYVTLRGGPYWGKVEEPAVGFKESKIGLNLNAAFGVVIGRRFYTEVRYDYFSSIAGYNFDGISLSAGVKLFDIKF